MLAFLEKKIFGIFYLEGIEKESTFAVSKDVITVLAFAEALGVFTTFAG